MDTGTVISGTLREEDLIPAFTEELWKHNRRLAEAMVDEHRDLFAVIDNNDEWVNGDYQEATYCLESLFDALDNVAPKGYYFGAHPGDGADFGFWPIELAE